MTGETTVYVVDDDSAVRESMQFLLESAGMPVRCFEDAAGLLQAISDAGGPPCACAVVDIRLPGMSGIELQEELRRRGSTLPIIIITGHGDVAAAVRALKAGAIDFIEKPFNDRQLLDRVRQALDLSTRHRVAAAIRDDLVLRANRLTRREQQVMARVVQGQLNKQIAQELGLSPKTVEVHRAHVMEKMDADSLAQLVRFSIIIETKPQAGA